MPGLVATGLCYGLGVGPVPFILMTTLFPQQHKSAGIVAAQVTRAAAVFAQLKVEIVIILSRLVRIGADVPPAGGGGGRGRDPPAGQPRLPPRGRLLLLRPAKHQEQVNLPTGNTIQAGLSETW